MTANAGGHATIAPRHVQSTLTRQLAGHLRCTEGWLGMRAVGAFSLGGWAASNGVFTYAVQELRGWDLQRVGELDDRR